MAGTIIADKIQTENAFLTLNVGQTLVATINSSGILNSSGGTMVGANGSVSNTAIAGVITGSQLASPLSLTGNVSLTGNLSFDSTGTSGMRLPAANTLSFHTAGTEDMRIDSAGNVGIGTTSPADKLDITRVSASNSTGGLTLTNTDNSGYGSGISWNLKLNSTAGVWGRIAVEAASSTATYMPFYTTVGSTLGEKMRISSAGDLLVGKTSPTTATVGCELRGSGILAATRSSGPPGSFNRTTDDGDIISLQQDGTQEGSISVSGTTVSYNGGHLSRYAQIANGNTNIIFKGTVLSNLDEMNVYIDADGNPVTNEQLNKVKVSDTEGDANVAGVFVNWAYDEQHDIDEINMAMTGDMIIRIAEGVTVQKGDLLMSAGDGTAKPQSDDIVRSKTIAKVTSNHVTCTYEDGSYCVPCVLMAC